MYNLCMPSSQEHLLIFCFDLNNYIQIREVTPLHVSVSNQDSSSLHFITFLFHLLSLSEQLQQNMLPIHPGNNFPLVQHCSALISDSVRKPPCLFDELNSTEIFFVSLNCSTLTLSSTVLHQNTIKQFQVQLMALTFELSPNVAVIPRMLLFVVVLELVE